MFVDPSVFKPNSELRRMARERLRGNWTNPVVLSLVFVVLSGVAGGVPFLGPIIALLIGGPLLLGFVGFFVRFVRREDCMIENLFEGFSSFVPAMVLYLLIALFTVLWSFLLIIPGIIAALSYSQAFFIMYDNPQIEAMDAIRLSKQMMQGQKWKLFELHLSFIGWGILCILTLGIGFIWLIPYIYTSLACFYEDLKRAAGPDALRPDTGPIMLT